MRTLSTLSGLLLAAAFSVQASPVVHFGPAKPNSIIGAPQDGIPAAPSATYSNSKVKQVNAAAFSTSVPVCNAANNGLWACIPDRAQCYNGAWLSYPCQGGTVCANGDCVWPGSTSVTASTSTVPPPTSTTTSARTSTSTSPAPTGTITGPKLVTYVDNTSGSTSGSTFGVPGTVPANKYNVVNLAFWQSYGPWDTVYTWNTLDAATRSSYLDAFHAAGKKVLVTAFGAAEWPTSSGVNPTTAANNLAAFVKANGFDGADIDWEDNSAMSAGTGEAWLVTFTKALRAALPSPYIITHAPQAPYFINNKTMYPNGAYLTVHKQVGNLIDWYNVQFYNQGSSDYATCDALLNTSDGTFTGTALFQIAANGVDLNKLVIGKPVTPAGATNTGYVDVNTLAGCLSQAKAKGWDAGVMGWQYSLDPSGSWIGTLSAAL